MYLLILNHRLVVALMKRLSALLCLVALMLIGGCTKQPLAKVNYSVAVVQTTGQSRNSLITYYNNQLKPVRKQHLSYPSLGSTWNNEVYADEYVFLIPLGFMKSEKEHKVLGINRRSGSTMVYPIDRTSLQGIAVSPTHLYATSNLNGVNYITQLNRKNGNTREIELPLDYVKLLMYHNGNLFVFSTQLNNIEHNRLFVYNEKMELKREIDLAKIPPYIQKASFLNNKLIFTATSDPNQPIPAQLGIVKLDSWQVSTFPLKEPVANDILTYKNKLIIANTDVVEPRGHSISLVDLDSKEVTVHDLKSGVDRIALSGDTLYALGADELASYDISHDFALKKHINHISAKGLGRSSLFVAKP